MALKESDEIALSHKLHSASGRALPMIAHLAFDRGDFDAAQATFDELAVLGTRCSTPSLRLDIASIGARLALHNHKPALARKRFQWSLSEILRDKVGQRRTYCLAIYVAIEL